jgi:hypothetical protein
MSNIVVYKLTNGQEIIGKQVESKKSTLLVEQRVAAPETTDEVFLEDVRVIDFQPGPGGQLQVGMFPWMISATSSTVTLKKTAIAAFVEAERLPKQLIDAYLSNTSGLQIANAGALK